MTVLNAFQSVPPRGPDVHILTNGMFPTVLAPRRQSFTIESRESSQQSSLKRWKLKKGGI